MRPFPRLRGIVGNIDSYQAGSSPANGISASGFVAESGSVCMFVKLLEKYGYDDIAVLLSESGFDGADITLRKGGLIAPETAGTEFPKLIKALAKKNISVPMVASGITDPAETDRHALERIQMGYTAIALKPIAKNHEHVDESRATGLRTRHTVFLC